MNALMVVGAALVVLSAVGVARAKTPDAVYRAMVPLVVGGALFLAGMLVWGVTRGH